MVPMLHSSTSLSTYMLIPLRRSVHFYLEIVPFGAIVVIAVESLVFAYCIFYFQLKANFSKSLFERVIKLDELV